MVHVAAVDLGASSGRVMLGEVGTDHLRLTAVARFANGPVRTPDGLHWDLLELYRQSLDGLRAAAAAAPDGLASVGIDSWAVDYGLLRDGRLLGQPFHYRDERRGARGPALVHYRVPAADLYARTGLQFLPFNTVYQLAADEWTSLADRLLLVPDLLAHWLTGAEVAERTNASTTGLLSVTSGEWDDDLVARLGISRGLLADLVDPGTTIGTLLAEVGEAVGAPGLRVVAVGSHDTASAVVGVPLDGAEAAYISLGTWGLVGLELDTPVLTDAARTANFTNEGGVDGTIRFLTNVMGTWLLSETLRTWGRSDLGSLLAAAASVTGPVPVFDVQDPRFVPPGDMPARIRAWFAERGDAAPDDDSSLVRCIVESLATAYDDALRTAAGLAGREIRKVHVVGGGSQNALLCQAIADRTGLPVIAGPVEATALGNVLVQARAAGAVDNGLDALRDLVRRTHDLQTFEPAATGARLP
jgi:rhamnulokinase